MREMPGAQTPWVKINQLLAPDERFEVTLPHWRGFLLSPKYSSQLAAIDYILQQEKISTCIQGRGSCTIPSSQHSIIISARAFNQIAWCGQGIIEAGAGSSFLNLKQFLIENRMEIGFEEKGLASAKRSIAGLLLSGQLARRRKAAISEVLLGMEFVTEEGSQVKWGGKHLYSTGHSLHALVWDLQQFSGVITKFIFKADRIPEERLFLSWKFKTKESLQEFLRKLKSFSSTWDFLEIVLSGNEGDASFIFAQISGLKEEMNSFKKIFPWWKSSSQGCEKESLKNFLGNQKLNIYSVDVETMDQAQFYHLESGEYLWMEEGSASAFLLTSRLIEETKAILPIWKQRFYGFQACVKTG